MSAWSQPQARISAGGFFYTNVDIAETFKAVVERWVIIFPGLAKKYVSNGTCDPTFPPAEEYKADKVCSLNR